MANEQARELRDRGIKAARAGQKDEARKLLKQSIKLEPDSETAWLWLASVARDQRERVFCLQKLLEINPDNETGLKALRAMGVEPPPRPAKPEPQTPPPAPVQTRIDDSVVPVPDFEKLDDLKTLVDDATLAYLNSYGQSEIEWIHKTKRRVGERDIWTLRFQVAGTILGVLAILAFVGVIFVANSPEAQKLLFAPTWTPSKTATNTPTPTPGFTPTPSPTLDTTTEPTYTPSPTIPPLVPTGNSLFTPSPTQPHLPERPAPAIVDALKLMEQGKYDEALPILAAERQQTTLSFNPNPYYYEAIAQARAGDPQAGLKTLAEAETRLETVPGDSTRATYRALIDVGYADVYLQLAQEALTSGSNQQAQNFLRSVENKTRSVIQLDPDFGEAYLLLSRRFSVNEQYNNAMQALNDGLAVPSLMADLNLRIEKGKIYFDQGEYDLAAQQAYEVLYIDVYSEPAYLLQIRSTLAQGKAGLAVIYSENYRHYYPDSLQGFKLLGDARVAEGNTDLALEVYTNALQQSEANDPELVDVLVSRAALYSQQRRYDLAREDLTQALAIKAQPEIQALRMEAAYRAGNYAIALNDADELLGTGAIPDVEIELMQARILVDQAGARDQADLQQATEILSDLSGLPAELQPIASEYRARAGYLLEDYATALTAINNAMGAGETGSRHYWRGLILEAQGKEENIVQAIRDYEWVVTWSAVYPYSFFQDARQRLEKLTAPPPEEATPTPETS